MAAGRLRQSAMTPVLLISRPFAAAERFGKAVMAALDEDVPIVISPAFEVVPLDVASVPAHSQVIFTSANGVEQAARLGLPHGTAWCVGDKTAAAARDIGFDAISAGGSADDLVELLKERRPQGALLHVAGVHTRGDIRARLNSAGVNCISLTAYDQRLLQPNTAVIAAARGTNPIVAPVFSPRSAHILGGLDWTPPVHAIAISHQVADCVTDLGCDTVVTAQHPSEGAMIDATTATLRTILDR